MFPAAVWKCVLCLKDDCTNKSKKIWNYILLWRQQEFRHNNVKRGAFPQTPTDVSSTTNPVCCCAESCCSLIQNRPCTLRGADRREDVLPVTPRPPERHGHGHSEAQLSQPPYFQLCQPNVLELLSSRCLSLWRHPDSNGQCVDLYWRTSREAAAEASAPSPVAVRSQGFPSHESR